MKRVLLAAIFVLVLALPAARVRAAGGERPAANPCIVGGPDYDPERCVSMAEGLGMMVKQWGVSFAVSLAQVVDLGIWALARLVVGFFALAVEGNWLDLLRERVLGGLMAFMPQALRSSMLGPNGLLYVGLMVAGLSMCFPLLANGLSRLARPERVLFWGVFVAALFVSSTAGYDLVGAVEGLRVDLMRLVTGGEQAGSARQLVLVPMRATAEEGAFTFETLMTLPDAFRRAYFPEAELMEIGIKFSEHGISMIETEVESPESLARRATSAGLSVLYALLTLGGAYILGLFSWGFLYLGVAALVLILFLFAALPLGVFEVGAPILYSLLQRYVQVVVYSLAMGIFLRLASGLMGALPGLASPGALLEWLLLLAVLGIALRALNGATFQAMKQSFTSFMGSVRGGLGLARQEGPLESPGGARQALGQAAMGALFGAMSGGAPGAVVGAAASLLGGSSLLGGVRHTLPAETHVGQEAARAPAMGNVFLDNGFAPGAGEATRRALESANLLGQPGGQG